MLGIRPLRLGGSHAGAGAPAAHADAVAGQPAAAPEVVAFRRLALQPDPAELETPALRKMYEALTEAVGKAGLQRIRVCDAADDPGAAVMVFGSAALPEGVPPVRVLRADPLAVLHGDRERKRLLWEQMQALGRRGNG
jgi:hypothetical protein